MHLGVYDLFDSAYKQNKFIFKQQMKFIIFAFFLLILIYTSSVQGYTFLKSSRHQSHKKGEYDAAGSIKYLFYGFDIRHADSFQNRKDPGLKIDYPIFMLAKKDYTVNFNDLKVPEGLDITPEIGDESTERTSNIKSQSDYLKSMSFSLSLDSKSIPIPLANSAFTASATYKSLKTDTLSRGKTYLYSYTKCTRYLVGFDLSKIQTHSNAATAVKLSQEFTQDATSLPTSYSQANSQAFKTFFDKYGTHYFKRFLLGGRTLTLKKTNSLVDAHKTSRTMEGSLGSYGVKGQVTSQTDASHSRSEERGESFTFSSGSCKTDKEYMPIEYKLDSLLNLIKSALNKDITGVTDEVLCELAEGHCKPIDPIIAVTDITYKSSSDKASESSEVTVCDHGYEDATKAVRNSVNSKYRVNIHGGNVGNFKYICQKKENIVNENGSFKPYISAAPGEGPTIYDEKLTQVPSGHTCIMKKGQIHDLNKGFSTRYRYVCWTMANNPKTKKPLLDVAISGADSTAKFDTTCSSEKWVSNKVLPNTDYEKYRCSCLDMNKKMIGSFYNLCFSDAKKEE